jgi:hypothetical protein
MEVAIRSVNIVLTLSILKEKNVELSEDFIELVSNFLYFSCLFIYRKREWSGGLRNNHYLANLLGTFIITSSFPEDKTMQKINRFADKEFAKEIEFQFNNEGSNFEGSLPYHFFSVEMVYLFIELSKLSDNFHISEKLKIKLTEICKFSSNLYYENKIYPQIGDNDSGKIININDISDINDTQKYHFYIKTCLSSLFNKEYVDDTRNIKLNEIDKYNIYKDIGLFIYETKNYKIFVSLGRKAQNGKGGHNHIDSTSFVLFSKGKEIFSDPGTYIYTSFPEMRNELRSAKSHNCFFHNSLDTFDNSSPEDLFWLSDKPCEIKFETTENSMKLLLQKRIKNNRIKRVYILSENEISIIDEIDESLRNGYISFHLHPKRSISDSQIENTIKIDEYIEFNSKNKINIEKYNYSPEYGVIENAKVLISLSTNKLNKFQIRFL